MLKSFNQGSTLPADFKQIILKTEGQLPRFFSDPSVCVCLQVDSFFVFLVDLGCPGDRFGGHFGVLEHPEAPNGTTETQRERQGVIWCEQKRMSGSHGASPF